MPKILKSIRFLVAALACLWPMVFVAGLPAAASVLPPDSSVSVVGAEQVLAEGAAAGFMKDGLGVLQRHEPSFFLDADPAAGRGSTLIAPAPQEGSPVGSQHAAASGPFSLGMIAVVAVLLLAAFNARKRRSRPALAQG